MHSQGQSAEQFDDVAVIYLKRPQKLIEERLKLVNEDGARHSHLGDERRQSYAANDRMYRAAANYIFEFVVQTSTTSCGAFKPWSMN